MPPDEYAEPTELEQDALRITQQWVDDLNLEVRYRIEPDGVGGQEIVTLSVVPQYGEEEFQTKPRRDGDVDTWRAWVEAEYAPSFYVS